MADRLLIMADQHENVHRSSGGGRAGGFAEDRGFGWLSEHDGVGDSDDGQNESVADSPRAEGCFFSFCFFAPGKQIRGGIFRSSDVTGRAGGSEALFEAFYLNREWEPWDCEC